MVRINKDKLIIEIKSPHPLSTLADFQNGLLTMIQIANLNSMNCTQTVEEGVRQTSMLIKEMLISYDQGECITDSFNDEEIIQFNKR